MGGTKRMGGHSEWGELLRGDINLIGGGGVPNLDRLYHKLKVLLQLLLLLLMLFLCHLLSYNVAVMLLILL